ncbi:MAG: 50S ribosomal protein L24 [Acidobacteriota bacterium]
MHVRKNDTVEVVSGKDSGKRGRVLSVQPRRNRAVVENIAYIKRHTRANPQKNIKGGVVEREAPIHISNLMVVCVECGKRTRVAYKFLDDGTKIRICRRCEGVLDRAKG